MIQRGVLIATSVFRQYWIGVLDCAIGSQAVSAAASLTVQLTYHNTRPGHE